MQVGEHPRVNIMAVKAGVAARCRVAIPSPFPSSVQVQISCVDFGSGTKCPDNLAFSSEFKFVNFPFLSAHLHSMTDNYQFLKGMKNLVEKSGHKLKICYEYLNRGDRWMQVK